LASLEVRAQETPHVLVIDNPSILYRWPGPDGHIDTGDDLEDANDSPTSGSSSNALASFSYNAFDFDGSGTSTDPTRLPLPMNAVTFLAGAVIVNEAAFQGSGTNNVPIIDGWTVTGSEPFPGHGPYTSITSAVNSGTFNTVNGDFTLNVNFTAILLGGTATAVNFDMAGEAYLVADVQFAKQTGNDYVDNVLVPMAKARQANSLVYIRGTGTVPASTGGSGGSFPEMPIEAVLVGLDLTGVATDAESWGSIKSRYEK